MTVIDVTAAVTAIGGRAAVQDGSVLIEYLYGADGAPSVRTDGTTALLPNAIRVPIVDGVPTVIVDVPPTDARCYARVTVQSVKPYAPSPLVLPAVAIPGVGPVAISALVAVDPGTYEPVTDVVTAWELVVGEVSGMQADVAAKTAQALEAATDAGTFAGAADFDANRAGGSAFAAGQSAASALGHKNDAKASADAAVAAAASIVLATTYVKLSAGLDKATANVAAINAAIAQVNAAGGGVVEVPASGVYYIDDHILMRSNITLRLGPGVTIRKADAATGNVCMLRNANPTAGDVLTDANMVIEGGTWDGNYANNQSTLAQADKTSAAKNSLLYGIQGDLNLIGVRNVTIRNTTIVNCNGFAVHALGTGVTLASIALNTARDGMHISGPSQNVTIRDVTGYTDDDFIALNAWDWHRSSPASGDIQGVIIQRCTYLGTGPRGHSARAIKFLVGTRTTGAGQGVGNIRDVVVEGLTVNGGPGVGMLSDFDQVDGAEYSGAGTIQDVTFIGGQWASTPTASAFTVYKDSNGAPADGQTQLTLRNIVFQSVRFDSTAGSSAALIDYRFAGLSMQGVTFRDCSWKSAPSGQSFLNVRSKDPLDGIEIDGLIIETTQTPNSVVLINTYGTNVYSRVKSLAMRRLRTALGVTIDGPVLNLNGTVDRLIADAWELTFAGGSGDNHGIVFQPGGVLSAGILSRLNLLNPKTLFAVRSGATGSVICRAAVVDSIINGCVHPVFVSGGKQADITFRGGSILTGSNLARVDGSTLTLTLDGVTSSGSGANVITPVNTPTIRVPRSDRVALPLNTLPLTPQDGDWIYSSGTPSQVVSGSGAGMYVYRGGSGWVKLN
ncbi:hypothetical protein [uncultured Microbacterium sp.]|uniref:hypothetical protein n=1 Tax=uncultured Microbacterium sp. TaxID=191216 RepID=UPI0025ECD404|nr:hypothetical protein [uncultured Microbacterium sp.]